MFKRFSVFVLAAVLIASCSSKEEENKKRTYQETVHAFINSNPDIGGFGRVDINAIMNEGQIESNEAFKMFGSKEYSELKEQLDISAPVYFAMEPKESEDVIGYVFAKLKDQEKFVTDFQQSGYTFKEHDGITFAEDGDFLWGLRNETVIVVITPGKFNGKQVITKAFGYADGKMAGKELKEKIERPGDVTMHVNTEKMAQNNALPGVDLTGTEVDLSIDFENGKMIFAASTNNTENLKKQLQLEERDTPIIAKKIVDSDGNVVMAMQSRLANPMMNMALMNDMIMEEIMSNANNELAQVDATLSIVEMEEGEVIKMPGNQKAMGSAPFEVILDLGIVGKVMPEFAKYAESLDYATFEIDDSSMKLVIATKKSDENFLATILKIGEQFFISGDWMQVAMR